LLLTLEVNKRDPSAIGCETNSKCEVLLINSLIFNKDESPSRHERMVHHRPHDADRPHKQLDRDLDWGYGKFLRIFGDFAILQMLDLKKILQVLKCLHVQRALFI
jgi:hypothetical protein